MFIFGFVAFIVTWVNLALLVNTNNNVITTTTTIPTPAPNYVNFIFNSSVTNLLNNLNVVVGSVSTKSFALENMRWFTITFTLDPGVDNYGRIFNSTIPLTSNTNPVPHLAFSNWDPQFYTHMGSVSLDGNGGFSVTFILGHTTTIPMIFSVSYAVQSLI